MDLERRVVPALCAVHGSPSFQRRALWPIQYKRAGLFAQKAPACAIEQFEEFTFDAATVGADEDHSHSLGE